MRGVEDGRGAGGGNERARVVEGVCERDCASRRARRSSRKRAHFAKTVIEKRDGEDM